MSLIYANAGDDRCAPRPAGTDPRSIRMRNMLLMPDLSRKGNSPVYHVARAVLGVEALRGCDEVIIPDSVTVKANFDDLNSPPDHPSRGHGDTFYVDEAHVLRTHTTSFWSYYLGDPAVRERLERDGMVTAVSYGKIYRNDEVDRNHYPVFHQMDGLCLAHTRMHPLSSDDLERVVVQIAQSVYGPGVEYRISPETYPFTNPSIQLEVRWKHGWLELMGGGMVHPQVLRNLGMDPREYCGWAFGFGLDRIAMIKAEIPDIRILWLTDERVTGQFTGPHSVYHAVSKYPPVARDVSLLVKKTVPATCLYETMRACGDSNGEDLIEEVRMIDRYESESLGAENVSHTFRITYRSHLRTLTGEEVNRMQEDVRTRVVREWGVVLR